MSDSLRPCGALPGSSAHGIFAGKNAGVGCHFLLQRIFQTQGLNLGLLHCTWILYHLSHHSLGLINLKADLYELLYRGKKVIDSPVKVFSLSPYPAPSRGPSVRSLGSFILPLYSMTTFFSPLNCMFHMNHFTPGFFFFLHFKSTNFIVFYITIQQTHICNMYAYIKAKKSFAKNVYPELNFFLETFFFF